jgi:hypothetical protein
MVIGTEVEKPVTGAEATVDEQSIPTAAIPGWVRFAIVPHVNPPRVVGAVPDAGVAVSNKAFSVPAAPAFRLSEPATPATYTFNGVTVV